VKCPKCKYNKTRTSWVKDKGDFTLRARLCPICDNKFQTKEMTSNGWNYKVKYNNLIKELKKCIRKELNYGMSLL